MLPVPWGVPRRGASSAPCSRPAAAQLLRHVGRPAALQEGTPLEKAFEKITQNVVQEMMNRNEHLPPTEVIKITTMAGCSSVKN